MRRVEVNGALELDLDGRTLDVWATGSHVRADVRGAWNVRPTFRLVATSFVLARRLARALDSRGLTLSITRDGKPFADLGAGVRPAGWSKLARLGRVRVLRT